MCLIIYSEKKKKTFFFFLNFAVCVNYSEVFSCSGCCIRCIRHLCRSPVCATACARWRFVLCCYASTCTYIRESVFNKGLYAKYQCCLALFNMVTILNANIIPRFHNTHNVILHAYTVWTNICGITHIRSLP